MPPLTPLHRNDLIKKLKIAGFSGPFSGTRHQYLEKGAQKIFIPNPHGKEIGIPLLKQIIKQLGIGRQEFLEL